MTHEEFVSSLWLIADFYTKHPEVPIPYLHQFDIYDVQGKEQMAIVARAFGDCQKEIGATMFVVKKTFGSITLRAADYRKNICTARVVGTKHVEEHISPGIPERVTPAHEEDIIEWDCPSLLESSPATEAKTSDPVNPDGDCGTKQEVIGQGEGATSR